MAYDERDRSRRRERGRWRDEEERWRGDESNRGMFGYEGEGYMHGGGRDVDYDFDRSGGDRGYDREYGGRDSASGLEGSRYGNASAGRNDYGRMRGSEMERYESADRDFADRLRNAPERSDWRMNRGYGHGTATERIPAHPSYRGRGPKGYQRSDERIHEDLCERLYDDDGIDASGVEVTVSGGTVTLNGSVDDRWQKRRAEDLAEQVSGVHDVQNNLRLSNASMESRMSEPRLDTPGMAEPRTTTSRSRGSGRRSR